MDMSCRVTKTDILDIRIWDWNSKVGGVGSTSRNVHTASVITYSGQYVQTA